MQITWLGQAGLLFETNRKTILIDPYLSDSVSQIEPHNKRRVPVEEKFLKLKPDYIVLTHNHLDHTDPETLKHYLNADSKVCVLASYNAWQNVRKLFGGLQNNYVMFNKGTRWAEGELQFEAVYAEHSDDAAIGVILRAEGKVYYITGDTLYNKKVFEDLPDDIDFIFLPVNGKGNNMNMTDGKAFCEEIGATAIPLHCGLFDAIDLHEFAYADKVVPEFYKVIEI